VRASLGWQGGRVSGGSPFVDYDREVSASAVVTQPLFAGGLLTSRVRQAAERNNVDRINIESNRRLVLQSVSQAWNQLLGARASLAANEEQVRAAAIAFEGTRQEAQVGLRTTLDVLDAEQELRNAQFALVSARHDEYVAGAALLSAMGALSAANLTPTVPLYDPKTNFNRVKRSFGWVPWEPVIAAVDSLAAPRIITPPPAPQTPATPAAATGSPAP
jgi:outer membrane protein